MGLPKYQLVEYKSNSKKCWNQCWKKFWNPIKNWISSFHPINKLGGKISTVGIVLTLIKNKIGTKDEGVGDFTMLLASLGIILYFTYYFLKMHKVTNRIFGYSSILMNIVIFVLTT